MNNGQIIQPKLVSSKAFYGGCAVPAASLWRPMEDTAFGSFEKSYDCILATGIITTNRF